VTATEVVDRVTRELEERMWPEDDVTAVQLALTEAVANAIRHGCRGDITERVQCSMVCVGGFARPSSIWTASFRRYST
jgi:anti-sigma regulatory factor (Ser/Thr protein kinase)